MKSFVFEPLGRGEVDQIVDKFVRQVEQRLEDRSDQHRADACIEELDCRAWVRHLDGC